jgi:hypothetical protein
MSGRGVFAVDRGIWSDPDFADEPFTEREAFMWLVGEAAWKPYRKRADGKLVDLGRGQLCHAVRFMAEAWGWSKSRVDRFLDRLENRDMIARDHGTRTPVLSVCNYDRFQRTALPKRDNISEVSGTRDKLESIKTLKEEKAPSASSSKPKAAKGARLAYSAEFEVFWSAYPKTDTANPKSEASKVFDRLAEDDRALAVASLPAFKIWIGRQFNGYNAPGAAVWLRQRRWERHAQARAPADPAKTRAQLRVKAECHFRGEWRPGWGPSPGEPGCTIPEDVVAEVARAAGAAWPAIPAGSPARSDTTH